MPYEYQFAREKIFECDQFLVVLYDGICALFPRQTNVRPETVFRTGAFVTCLHDAAPCTRNNHETRRGDLFAERERLLIFHLAWQRARGTEDGYFALVRIRREQFERVS